MCLILTSHFDLLIIGSLSFLVFFFWDLVVPAKYVVLKSMSSRCVCFHTASSPSRGCHFFLILLSTPAAVVAVAVVVVDAVDACSLAPSARFIIPQKLSQSVKSVPRSQRMSTRPGPQTILTARATGSSSSLELDSLPSSSPRASFSPFCCCWNFLFRLAERDQTFSLAKATPV
jgi:hypothetical protein